LEQIDPLARTGDARSIEPGAGIVPILKELPGKRLKVIGAGLYVTRYGLFVTARHVLEELVNWGAMTLGIVYVLHLSGDAAVHLRRVRSVGLLNSADIAIGQADNYLEKFPENPLSNADS
jgi:hypothetical protein